MFDVLGWGCEVCGAKVDLADPAPWRCPNATASDRHHVLHAIVASGRPFEPDDADAANPFQRYGSRLAWAAAAETNGMTAAARDALVHELDAAVRKVDGTGFEVTPFARDDVLSERLGFSADGGVWVKDETRNVGGSQKARHLFAILLHLRAMELLGVTSDRARLAIASCGNAALAAATLAAAADRPIDVYVPTWMSDGFGRRLDDLGATTHRCERRDDDPPGDPAMLRFREAVATGAVPFTVQGPENALCLDGGRTIGWEMAEQIGEADGPQVLDAVFVQVGGGAFASCLGAGLLEADRRPALMAVQTEGCAPFARALRRAEGIDRPGPRWDDLMTPWDDPASIADGILDDETYDWLGVLDAVRRTGGDAVVASEDRVARAHRLALEAGFDASPTGTAGLAGLLAAGVGRDEIDAEGSLDPDDRVAVVMSGITR